MHNGLFGAHVNRVDGNNMKQQLQHIFLSVLQSMGVDDVMPDVSISEDSAHGEYTTNVALRLAKQLKKSPMDVALQVKSLIDEQKKQASHIDSNHTIKQKDLNISANDEMKNVLQAIDRVEVVAPGFVNVFLTESVLSTQIKRVLKEEKSYGNGLYTTRPAPLKLDGLSGRDAQHIMVEFAHPNTHKAFHIGHLRNITTGESIVRLLEASGRTVTRVNYQGDVGMHIAKCLWAMTHLAEFDPASVRGKDIHERVTFLGKAYAAGSTRYETEEAVKKETGEVNKQIYAKDPVVYPLYEETRSWSLEYFSGIYSRVGTTFERLYFESEFYEKGKAFVRDGLSRGIFAESDGAIIFPGEKFGLHNRVFITKEGNATYEGKEIGLGRVQFDEYHPDLIMHVVGPEQAGYFQVLFEALAQMFPDTKGREYHKIYGWVKLKHGKMSSRTGQVVLGEWLLDEAKKSIYQILDKTVSSDAGKSRYTPEEKETIAETGAIAAVKYAFLRVGTNQEIAFDLKESVSFDGDSGPYLLYTYARCKSVLRKAGKRVLSYKKETVMNDEERHIARMLYFFPEVVSDAATTLSPNVICAYLFRLAALYNLFYQKHPILKESVGTEEGKKEFRLTLTAATAQVLHNGLHLLGIQTVESM